MRLEAEIGTVHTVEGNPAEAIVAFATEHGVREVHATQDSGPYGRERDARVAASLQQRGIELIISGSNYIVNPGTILNTKGLQMRTFRGFKQAWLRIARTKVSNFEALEAGESGPVAHLAKWVDELGSYPTNRDYPALEATSKLSINLRFGTIHPGRVLAGVAGRDGSERFIEQLCWREWYADNLWHDPQSAWRNGSNSARQPRCDTGEMARRRFTAWCAGQTGYPIVDAGMRQLNETGWMHNRVRMITASFLVKDLHLPWQWGARWFMEKLRDGDLASNNLSWQWVAGVGIDASPYYRIFNPGAQSERFDPDGEYIRTWVKELEDAGSDIHRPRTGSYVTPIVDHAVEREEALARHKEARGW